MAAHNKLATASWAKPFWVVYLGLLRLECLNSQLNNITRTFHQRPNFTDGEVHHRNSVDTEDDVSNQCSSSHGCAPWGQGFDGSRSTFFDLLKAKT